MTECNLRKISASPWCNTHKIIKQIGDDYVISRKPSPSIFVGPWSPEKAEAELRSFMQETEGKCHVEFIMKDISTVQYEPWKLWEWEKISMKVVEEYSQKALFSSNADAYKTNMDILEVQQGWRL